MVLSMKCFFFLTALIGVASPIIADVDFTALVELNPLNKNFSNDHTETKNSTKKVDIFVISAMFSGIDCNPLYVREWVETTEIPPQEEKQEVIAQAEELAPTPPPLPSVAPPEVAPQPDNFIAHFLEPRENEKPTSEEVCAVSEDAPTHFEDQMIASEAPPGPCASTTGICKNLNVLAGFGYRRDNLWWTNKHIHQDLGLDKAKAKDRFENVDIFLFTTSFRSTWCNCLYVRGTVDYGWIADGDEKQKDIFEVQKTVQAKSGTQPEMISIDFIEHSHIKRGNVWDLSIAAGFPITFSRCCCDCCNCCHCSCFTIAPLAGFSYNSMQFHSNPPSIFEKGGLTPLGPPYYEGYEGFAMGKSVKRRGNHPSKPPKHPKRRKSTYINSWTPFLGVDFAYTLKCVELFGELEFHVGRIHWRCSNRIPTIDLWHALHEVVEFKNKQSKTVAGVKFKTGIRGPFLTCWFYEADVSYQDFSTFKNNQIEWQSFEINLQIGRNF